MEQAESSSGQEEGAEPAKGVEVEAVRDARAQLPRLGLRDVHAALTALQPKLGPGPDTTPAGDDPLCAEAAAWFTKARLRRFAACLEKAPFLWRSDHLACKKTSIRALAYTKLLELLGEPAKGKTCVPRAVSLCRVFIARLKEQLQWAAEKSQAKGIGLEGALELCPPWARHADSYLQLLPGIFSHLPPAQSAPIEVQKNTTTASTAPCPYDFDTDSEQPETSKKRTKKQTRKYTKKRNRNQKNKRVPSVATVVNVAGDQETEIDTDLRNFATNIMGALTDPYDINFGSDQDAEINVELRKTHIANVTMTPPVNENETIVTTISTLPCVNDNSRNEHETIVTNIPTPPCVNDNSHNKHETIDTTISTLPCDNDNSHNEHETIVTTIFTLPYVNDNSHNEHETIVTNISTPCVNDNSHNKHETLITSISALPCVNDNNRNEHETIITNISTLPCVDNSHNEHETIIPNISTPPCVDNSENDHQTIVTNESTPPCADDISHNQHENITTYTNVSPPTCFIDNNTNNSDNNSEANTTNASMTPGVSDHSENESETNFTNIPTAPHIQDGNSDKESEINVIKSTSPYVNDNKKELEASTLPWVDDESIHHESQKKTPNDINDNFDIGLKENVVIVSTVTCAGNDNSDRENETIADNEYMVPCNTDVHSNKENETNIENVSTVSCAANDNSDKENEMIADNECMVPCNTDMHSNKENEINIENVSTVSCGTNDNSDKENEMIADNECMVPCNTDMHSNKENEINIENVSTVSCGTNDNSDKETEMIADNECMVPCNTDMHSNKENEINIENVSTVSCGTNDNSDKENETIADNECMVPCNTDVHSNKENEINIENVSTVSCGTNDNSDKENETIADNECMVPCNTDVHSNKENETNIENVSTVSCATNDNSDKENEADLENYTTVTNATNDNSIKENETEIENASTAPCATTDNSDQDIEPMIENVIVAPCDILSSDNENECAESAVDPLQEDPSEDEPGSKKSVTQLCRALLRRWIELQGETKTRIRSHLRVHTAASAEDPIVAVDLSDEDQNTEEQSNTNDDTGRQICDDPSINDDREFQAAFNKIKTALMLEDTDDVAMSLSAKDVEGIERDEDEPLQRLQTKDITVSNHVTIESKTSNCDDGKSTSRAKENNIVSGNKQDTCEEEIEDLIQQSLIKDALTVKGVLEQDTDNKHPKKHVKKIKSKVKVDLMSKKRNIYSKTEKIRSKSNNVPEQHEIDEASPIEHVKKLSKVDLVARRKTVCTKRQNIHIKSDKNYEQDIGRENPRKQSHAKDKKPKYNQKICSKKQKVYRSNERRRRTKKHETIFHQEPSNKVHRIKHLDKKFKIAIELVIKNTAALQLSDVVRTEDQRLVQQHYSKDTFSHLPEQFSDENSIKFAVKEKNMGTSRDDVETGVVRVRNYLFQRTHFNSMVFDQEPEHFSEDDDNGKDDDSVMSDETFSTNTISDSRKDSFDTTNDVQEGVVDVYVIVPSPEFNLRQHKVLHAPCPEVNILEEHHVDENVTGLKSNILVEHQAKDNAQNPPLNILQDNDVDEYTASPEPNNKILNKELEKIDFRDIVTMVDFDGDDENATEKSDHGKDIEVEKSVNNDAVDVDMSRRRSCNSANAGLGESDVDVAEAASDPKLLMQPVVVLKKLTNQNWVIDDYNSQRHKSRSPPPQSSPNFKLRRFSGPKSVKNKRALKNSSNSNEDKSEGTITKRVKLPDIEEVRRKNRKMLTAQVTPITHQSGPVSAICEHVKATNISTASGASSQDSCSRCTAQRLSSSPESADAKPQRGAAARARSFITSYAAMQQGKYKPPKTGVEPHHRKRKRLIEYASSDDAPSPMNEDSVQTSPKSQCLKKRRGSARLRSVSSDDATSVVNVDVTPSDVLRTSPESHCHKKRIQSPDDESSVVDVVSTRELITFEDEVNIIECTHSTSRDASSLLDEDEQITRERVSLENNLTSLNIVAQSLPPNKATSDQNEGSPKQELATVHNDRDTPRLGSVAATHIAPVPSSVILNEGIPAQDLTVQNEEETDTHRSLKCATDVTSSSPTSAPSDLNAVVPTLALTKIQKKQEKNTSVKPVKIGVTSRRKRKRRAGPRFTSIKKTSVTRDESEPPPDVVTSENEQETTSSSKPVTNFESVSSIAAHFDQNEGLAQNDQDASLMRVTSSPPDASAPNEDVATQDLTTVQKKQDTHRRKRKRRSRPRFKSDDACSVPDECEQTRDLSHKDKRITTIKPVIHSTSSPAEAASSVMDKRVHIRDLITFEDDETTSLEPVLSNAAVSALNKRETTQELTTIRSKRKTDTHPSLKRVKRFASVSSDADIVSNEGSTPDSTTTRNIKTRSSKLIAQSVSTTHDPTDPNKNLPTAELTTSQNDQPTTASKQISGITSVPSSPAPFLSDDDTTREVMQALDYSDSNSISYDDAIILSDDDPQDFTMAPSDTITSINPVQTVMNENTLAKLDFKRIAHAPSIPKATILATQDDVVKALRETTLETQTVTQDDIVKALRGTVITTQKDNSKARKGPVLATQKDVLKPPEHTVLTTQKDVAKAFKGSVPTTQDDIVKTRKGTVLATQDNIAKALKGPVFTTQYDVVKTRKDTVLATQDTVVEALKDPVPTTQDDIVKARKGALLATQDDVLKALKGTALATQDEVVKVLKGTTLATQDNVAKALRERRKSTDCNREPIISALPSPVKRQNKPKLGFKPLLYRQTAVPSSSLLKESAVDLAQVEQETCTDFNDRQNEVESSKIGEDDGNWIDSEMENDGNWIDSGIEKDRASSIAQPLTEDNIADMITEPFSEVVSDIHSSNVPDIGEELDNQAMDAPDDFCPVIVSVRSLAPQEELTNESNLQTQTTTVQPNPSITSNQGEPISLTSDNVQQVTPDDLTDNSAVSTNSPKVVACVIRVPSAQTNPNKDQSGARVSGSKDKLTVITLKRVKAIKRVRVTSPMNSSNDVQDLPSVSPVDPQKMKHLPKILNVSRVISLPPHVQIKTRKEQPKSVLKPPSLIGTSSESQVTTAPLQFRKILPKVISVSDIHLSQQTDPTNVAMLAPKAKPSNLPKITLKRAEPVFASYHNSLQPFLTSNSPMEEVQEETNLPRVVDVTGDLHVMQPDNQMGLHLVVSQPKVTSDVSFSNIKQIHMDGQHGDRIKYIGRIIGKKCVVSQEKASTDNSLPNINQVNTEEAAMLSDDQIGLMNSVEVSTSNDNSSNINRLCITIDGTMQRDDQMRSYLVIPQESDTNDSSPNIAQNDIDGTVTRPDDHARLNLVCHEMCTDGSAPINPKDIAENSSNLSETSNVVPRRISLKRRPSVPLLVRSVMSGRRDAAKVKKVSLTGAKTVEELVNDQSCVINYKTVEDWLISGCAATIPSALWARDRPQDSLVLLCVGPAVWATRGPRPYLLLSERALPPPVFALWTVSPRRGLELPDADSYSLQAPPRKIVDGVAYQKISDDPVTYAKLLVAVSDARACRDLLLRAAPLQLYCLHTCQLYPLRAEFLHDPPRFLLTGDAAVAETLVALKRELSQLEPFYPTFQSPAPPNSPIPTASTPDIVYDTSDVTTPGPSTSHNVTVSSATLTPVITDHDTPLATLGPTTNPNTTSTPDTFSPDDAAVLTLVSSRPGPAESRPATPTGPSSRPPTPASPASHGSVSTVTAPSRPSTPSTLSAPTPDISPALTPPPAPPARRRSAARSGRKPSASSRRSSDRPAGNKKTRKRRPRDWAVRSFAGRAPGALCARWAVSEEQFLATYRLPRARAQALVDELRPLLPPMELGDMEPDEKVLTCLSFLASGASPGSVSACAAIAQVADALNQDEIYKAYVRFPETPKERADIKHRFYELFKLPCVMGAMAALHVPVLEPGADERDYFNGVFHSLNVQVICDADRRILSADCGHGGATHSCAAWLEHQLNYHVKFLRKQAEKVCLLGDAGYPQQESTLTPVADPRARIDERYNAAHARAHAVVGQCIDRLRTRWRCLSTASETTAPTQTIAATIVGACAVLHNIAKDVELPVDEEFTSSERRVAAAVEAAQGTAASYLASPRGAAHRAGRQLERGYIARRVVARQLDKETRNRGQPVRPVSEVIATAPDMGELIEKLRRGRFERARLVQSARDDTVVLDDGDD